MSAPASLAGTRVLVTGGAGFIGRALVARLVQDGATVATFDLAVAGLCGVDKEYVGDLGSAQEVRRIIADADPSVVFHLAASRARTTEVSAFRPAIEANLLDTLSLVEAMQGERPDTRLVAVGTAEEYGGVPGPFRENTRELPTSAYSLSKLAMTRLLETLARVAGLRATVLRPSVAYGPGQAPDMLISALVEALVAGREMPMTAGEQTRDFVYVDDLVDALVRAAGFDAAVGRIINVGSGVPVPIRDVARMAEKLAGAQGLVKLGVLPYRVGEQMEYALDVSLAHELLGWTSRTSLEDGLRRTIDAARTDV